ncbi:MAG: M24 family metallopeptidase [Candidatus Methylomirabilia bacterium]
MSAPGPYPGRVSLLRAALRRRGLSALLITHLPNVRWLCGFSGSAGSLLVSARDAVFFSDFRYRAQSRREVRGARRFEYAGGSVAATAAAVRHARVARLGFEAERMTVALHGDLGAAMPGVELVPLRGMIEGLRAVKDAAEVALIRKALAIAAKALAASTYRLAGRSEIAVASRLRAEIRSGGGDDESFSTIVASGPRAALPHGLPTSRVIGGGDLVVIDYGVRLCGYCSDTTRTYSPLKWDKNAREIYRVVLEAQHAALDVIGPGVRGSDVDAAAREIIERAGHGKHFGHGTGHGVGLEVHELPVLSQRSGDILHPGMVVTVEPGIYVENFGGVRIEDMVLVTATGREILSRRIPKFLEH